MRQRAYRITYRDRTGHLRESPVLCNADAVETYTRWLMGSGDCRAEYAVEEVWI